jgi:uncharacterized protein (TIGR04222 family)
MSADRAGLLARIQAFDIDGGEVALPFAARLARENGWSRAYAARVVEEYKRFAFLAATGRAPVCPSEDVDAAWHLHLTYTKSYWQRFCADTLGRPLHHEPTKGGPAEGAKHLAMYADTLAAYRAAFGHDAPADIWPAGDTRFGDDLSHRAVNTARNWVIPKAPVKRVAGLALAFVLVALLVPGCNGGLNPFALGNKDFLTVLALALVGAVCAGRVLRSVLRKPNASADDDKIELDWEQSAYLVGGAPRLMSAAIARLNGRGALTVSDDGKTLRTNGPLPMDASASEAAVYRALPMTNEPTAMKPVKDAVEAAVATRAEQLKQDGLLLTTGNRARIILVSLVPLALVVWGLALPRFVMGAQAKNPTGFLGVLTIVGGLIALFITVAGSTRLSNRGAAVLARTKERNEALRSGTKWATGTDAGMAVALFGTAALAGTMYAPLQTWYPRQTTEGSSGGCGGGGCGSGCGGGGGGCGGGGCGGGGGD